MNHVPYKYTFLNRLRKMSLEDYQVAMKFIPDFLNIHYNTWRRWIYLKSDQSNEIPLNAALRLAVFFECSPSELMTNPMDNSELITDAWENYKNEFTAQLHFLGEIENQSTEQVDV